MASQSLGSGILLPEHNVARYCRPRWMVSGIVSRDAFLPRDGESFLSINWLEHFDQSDRVVQVTGVRAALAAKNFRVHPKGRFAILNVGVASQRVRQFQNLRLLFQVLGRLTIPRTLAFSGTALQTLIPRATMLPNLWQHQLGKSIPPFCSTHFFAFEVDDHEISTNAAY